MKSISLDFINNIVCIMSDGYQGTEYNPNLCKKDLFPFIPDKYSEYSSFTWNFENETFIVNQEYSLPAGAIATSDSFIPVLIIPMNGLRKRYKEFLDKIKYEEINIKNEMSKDLKKILGLE